MVPRQGAWHFALLCFLCFSLLVVASDDSPALQLLILLQFKQAITKDPLGVLHNWTRPSTSEPTTGLTPHLCSWYGIRCDLSQVVSIALGGCKLEGSITPLIGSITSLTSFDLSMNSMSGFVPHTLGMLPNLKYLRLSSNSFVGSIPASLSNCSSLILLDVSNNTMSGGIPAQLGALPTLKALLLPHNLLEGNLSASIFNASSALQFLDISYNRITGVVPDTVGNAKTLLSLNLSSNNLTGPMPRTLGEMVSLQGLDVSNNMLNGEVPSQLANCTFLSNVILSNNLLVGGIPARIGEMQSLRRLRLNNNLLSGALSSSLGNCTNMEDLVLSHNMFDGHIPIKVASLGYLLLSFDLSHNLLIGPIPLLQNSLLVLKIDLSHNKLSGGIQEGFGMIHFGLEYLDLSNNQLTGPLPQSILSLMFFNLSFNRLSGCFPQNEHIISSWIQGNPSLCVPSPAQSCICAASPSPSPPLALNVYPTRHPHLTWYIWLPSLTYLLGYLGILILCFCLSKQFRSIISQAQVALVTSVIMRLKGLTVYSVEDLNRVIDCIDTTALIGSGASSDVYRVQFGKGQVCALKCFKPTASQHIFDAQLDVLAKLRHHNLVPVRGFCRQGATRAIVLDYMENGSLKKQLHDMPRCTLDLERRIGIARDVAEGLVYLHSQCHVCVIHGDVKPANILLDKNYKAHVADFGLATYTTRGLTIRAQSAPFLGLAGTLGYIAPEYGAFKTGPTRAGDVYSYGVVVLELLTRLQPGQGNLPLPALVRSAIVHGNLESVLDPDLLVHMISKIDHDRVSLLAFIGLACAHEVCTTRPSMEDVISFFRDHPTFLE